MRFPIDDWQFWVGTAIVVGAVWWLVHGYLPKKKHETKVTLTVKGEKKK